VRRQRPVSPREWDFDAPHLPLLRVLDATSRAAWEALLAAHPDLEDDHGTWSTEITALSRAEAVLRTIDGLLASLDFYVDLLAAERADVPPRR
jgi:hypothetical protein